MQPKHGIIIKIQYNIIKLYFKTDFNMPHTSENHNEVAEVAFDAFHILQQMLRTAKDKPHTEAEDALIATLNKVQPFLLAGKYADVIGLLEPSLELKLDATIKLDLIYMLADCQMCNNEFYKCYVNLKFLLSKGYTESGFANLYQRCKQKIKDSHADDATTIEQSTHLLVNKIINDAIKLKTTSSRTTKTINPQQFEILKQHMYSTLILKNYNFLHFDPTNEVFILIAENIATHLRPTWRINNTLFAKKGDFYLRDMSNLLNDISLQIESLAVKNDSARKITQAAGYSFTAS
jgi:hypothetical protein